MATCKNCGGSGATKCPPCKGTGRIYHFTSSEKCRNCDGSGEAKCAVCRGKGSV